VESAPRAYRLKVSNAAPQFQHQAGQFPENAPKLGISFTLWDKEDTFVDFNN
jgi:hypothetical protein